MPQQTLTLLQLNAVYHVTQIRHDFTVRSRPFDILVGLGTLSRKKSCPLKFFKIIIIFHIVGGEGGG